MSRRNARRDAFHLLFQFDFHEKENEEELKGLFLAQKDDLTEDDKEFIEKIVNTAGENLDAIDELIGKYAKGWTVNRMSKVDLAILRVAVCEMVFIKETPFKVIINEAIELAKKYSSDESPAFINGILGMLSKGEACVG